MESGFKQNPVKVHQLTTVDSKNMPWEVDIVPFGEITQNKDGRKLHTIAWPPKEEIVMSVMGFNEAFLHALTVTILETPELHIKVTSPECMLFLKLISWLERDPITSRKDAADIHYLTKHYSKIPEVLEALYEQDFMEKQNYDELKACTMKLSREASKMAEPDTVKYINERLFADERMLDNLTLDMSHNIQIEYEEAESLLNIIKKQFREAE